VSEDKSYDIDVATAAEQSSEEDEAQEGMVLEQQEHSSDSAEHEAMHIVDDESVNVDEALEALESSSDEEADAVVRMPSTLILPKKRTPLRKQPMTKRHR
jgi:transcriptional antiterminator NusG